MYNMRKAHFFSNENHVVWGSVLVMMSSSLPTVVPLTTGHVTRVMEKTKNLNMLCSHLIIPEDKRGSAASAAEYYVHHYGTRYNKVRMMIYYLDYDMEEPGLADSVMECAEPPAGVCVSSDDMYVVDCISEKELHVHTCRSSGWLLTIYCVCNVHVLSQHLLVTCTYSAHCTYFNL